MFFQGAFLETLFYDFVLILYERVDLGTSSKCSGRQNVIQKSIKLRNKTLLSVLWEYNFSVLIC